MVRIRLLALASHVNVEGLKGLANYLGIKPSTIYGWTRNKNISDTGIVLAKIPNINREWLKNGEGKMFAPDVQPRLATATASHHSNAVAAEGCFSVSVSQGNKGGDTGYSERERRLIERMRNYAPEALWKKIEADLDELERRFR